MPFAAPSFSPISTFLLTTCWGLRDREIDCLTVRAESLFMGHALLLRAWPDSLGRPFFQFCQCSSRDPLYRPDCRRVRNHVVIRPWRADARQGCKLLANHIFSVCTPR